MTERLVTCDECKKQVSPYDIWCWDTQRCEDCYEAWVQKEIAYWKPLYDAERAMKRAYEDDDAISDF
jgi:hypothetical protein